MGSEKTISWDAPTYHDFGPVEVGIRNTFSAEITNTETEDFHLTYSLPDSAQGFIWGSGSMIFRPGTTRLFGVVFKPVVSPILLEGEGIARPEEYSVVPDSIGFGWQFVGDRKYAAAFLYNPDGVYFFRFEAGSLKETNKMILAR